MSWVEIYHLLNIHNLPPGAPLELRFNVATTTQVQMVLPLEDGARVAPVRWGWRPHWAQDWAAWMPCPTCRERFAQVNDCEACAGQGLVPAPVPSPDW